MKKKLALLLVLFISVLTLTACGNNGKKYYEGYKYLNFKEVLQAEEMELENPEYTEADDQAIIYLFRGQGCGFCRKFITFLNSISKEYGKYFKVVSFEVWYDENNAELMGKMPTVTNVEARGVPYIIIGDKVFDGYAETYDEQIKSKIMEQYKDNSYDVFEELAKEDNKFKGFSNTAIVIINLVLILIATVCIIVNSNKNTKVILDALNKTKKDMPVVTKNSLKEETPKTNKKKK